MTGAIERSTPSRRQALGEALRALMVQAALVAAFLWTPLSRYGEVHYTSADLTQALNLTQLDPAHQPGNQLLSDAVTQMQPWLLFNREELRQGRFPSWNPWNGAGTPHFANYQSAVLSPYSLPFYLLDFKAALLVASALKLLSLGFFTYLFLRRLGCGWLAATVGGAAFQFAGHNVLLLSFPHVGAMIALPAGVYFAETALRRTEDALAVEGRARLFGPLAGLCASFLVGLLAGNPEPFYFSALAVGAWTATRLVGLYLAQRASRRNTLELCRAAGLTALAVALAAGFAALQVLPFLEYLEHSLVLRQRSLRQTPLELRWWPLWLFPDALGNPSGPYNLSDGIPPPNYELVHLSYTGGAALLLAALCPFLARARRGGLFFPLFGALWFVYAHDVGGAADLFARLPTLALAPMNRSQGVWCFAVACAAALALDALLARRSAPAPFLAAWSLIAAAAAVVACLLGVERLIEDFALVESPGHAAFLRCVPRHLSAMVVWTALAALACAALLVVRAGPARTLLGALAGAALFAQTGWLLRDYNPVSQDRLVFPRTPAIERLRAHVGRERVAILGQDAIPPDSNLAYELALLSSYDGMWLHELDYLYRDQFGDGDNWRPILRGSARALRLFGTRWVLAKWGWNFLDNGLREHPRNLSLRPVRLPLLPGRTAVQTFRCRDDELSRVMVVVSAPPEVRECTLRLRVEELETGALVAERSLASHEVLGSLYTRKHVRWESEPVLDPPGRPVVFRFEPRPDSAGRGFRLTLSCEGGVEGDTLYAWHMPVLGYGPGESSYAGRKLPGELLFDWSCAEDRRYEEVDVIGDYTLLRLRDVVQPYALVEDSVVATDQRSVLSILRSISFDPRRAVVLDAGDEQTRLAVEELTRAARERRIVQFDDAEHCYLVAPDGRGLARIDDEATFLANRFDWRQLEKLPAAERASYELIPDDDREAKARAGLRLIGRLSEESSPLEVLEETPSRIRLRLSRPRPGYLVAANAWDPGWHARLNGEEAPVLRANLAFQAIAVPAGTSEVELRYSPRALAQGLWIAAGCALVSLGAFLSSRRSVARAT